MPPKKKKKQEEGENDDEDDPWKSLSDDELINEFKDYRELHYWAAFEDGSAVADMLYPELAAIESEIRRRGLLRQEQQQPTGRRNLNAQQLEAAQESLRRRAELAAKRGKIASKHPRHEQQQQTDDDENSDEERAKSKSAMSEHNYIHPRPRPAFAKRHARGQYPDSDVSSLAGEQTELDFQQRRGMDDAKLAFFRQRGIEPSNNNQRRTDWQLVGGGGDAPAELVVDVEREWRRQQFQQQQLVNELPLPTPSATPRGRGGRPPKPRSVSQASLASGHDPSRSADGNRKYNKNWVVTIWSPLTAADRRRIEQLIATGALSFFHGHLQRVPRQGPNNNATDGRHWQCYIECPKRMTADRLRELFGIDNIFFQERHGTSDQAMEYIDNSETNVSQVDNKQTAWPDNDIVEFTVGTRAPASNADAWAQVRAAVEAGGTYEDVCDTHFRLAVQYPTGINKVIAAKTKAKPRDVKCYCFWGPTGSGKTTKVYDTYGYEDVYRKLAGQWWDGYESQKVIFFDDYYGSEYGLTFDYLLQVTDRHPLTVNVRNGTRAAQWDKVIFTSNEHPYTWFPKVSEAKLAAFKRRLPAENIIYVPLRQPTPSTVAASELSLNSPLVGMIKRENAFSIASAEDMAELV